MNRINIAIIGILLSCIYFFVVIIFILTSSTNWLMVFDIVTMVSGIYYVFLINALPFSKDRNNRKLAVIFVATLMVMTNIAHAINLTSIQNIKNGIDIPDYLQIGKTLSILTSIEYLGWGIFLGFSFLFSSLGILNKRELKHLKATLFICSCLCIIGFFGWLMINENFWYIASIGYGIGALIICIELLLFERRKKYEHKIR